MLKIRFDKHDWYGCLAVQIFSVGNQINSHYKFGTPKREDVEEGQLLGEPSLKIYGNPDEIVRALKEAIRDYEGSTPDFAQGELIATKYHLEDLRILLKIKEKK